MSVHEQSSFRRELTSGQSAWPARRLGSVLAAMLLVCGLHVAAAEEQATVTIRPAPPRTTRPAPPAPAPKKATATPHQATAPQRQPSRRVARAHVRRRTRTHAAAEPEVAATPTLRSTERHVRTTSHTDRTRVATRRSDSAHTEAASTSAPRDETSRATAAPRRKLRSRTAGYRQTRRMDYEAAPDSTDATPRRRRHSRREKTAAPTDSDSPADSGNGKGASRLNAIGFRLIRQHRYAEAESYLRRAVAQDPNYAYAQYNLGCSLLAQGKAAQALGPLQHSAAQQPERWEPQDKLAEAYRRLDNDDQAAAAAARAKHLRRHRRSGHAFPSIGPKTAKAVPVRSAVDSGSWMGSTDRREQRFLTEWRAMR